MFHFYFVCSFTAFFILPLLKRHFKIRVNSFTFQSNIRIRLDDDDDVVDDDDDDDDDEDNNNNNYNNNNNAEIRSEIKKRINSVCNKEELLRWWKDSAILRIRTKDDNTFCSNHRPISYQLYTKFYPTSCCQC